LSKLYSDFLHRRRPQRSTNDARHGQERVKGRRILGVDGVDERHGENHAAGLGHVGPVGETRAVLIALDALGKVDVGVNDGVGGVEVVAHDAAPDVARGALGVGKVNDVHVEAGDEAKVARAALERPPEIRVVRAVGVDDGAVGQDDLKVVHIVAGKAVRGRVERVAPACDEASHAHGAGAPARDGDAVRSEGLVDALPFASGWY
jgi:hypothetical protein